LKIIIIIKDGCIQDGERHKVLTRGSKMGGSPPGSVVVGGLRHSFQKLTPRIYMILTCAVGQYGWYSESLCPFVQHATVIVFR